MEPYDLALGSYRLRLYIDNGFIVSSVFEKAYPQYVDCFSEHREVVEKAKAFLESYQKGYHAYGLIKPFLLEPHTDFQGRLRLFLWQTEYGTTLSYAMVAKALYSSPQGVGQALRANPYALFVPCHRIVGKKDLGGYQGDTDTEIKAFLLAYEKNKKNAPSLS